MHPFHNEDCVCPSDPCSAEGFVSIVICADRASLDPPNIRKDVFGRGASQPIPAAHEQEMLFSV
jgi:hypothetical protein